MHDDDLSPQIDLLQHVEAPDPLVTYYTSLARAAGLVYASTIKQLIGQMYRDHDYLQRRQEEHRHTGYDDAKLRDLQALAWLIQAAAKYLPEELRRTPLPAAAPKPKRKRTPPKKKP